jgi:prepilin-type N-terminal cleavage/methylation domain-containing protein
MKKIFSFVSRPGFTMIELLIVIAILGILAVAVLSAINPVEQINRGRDTGSRSDAEQLLSGIDRFNAFQGYYPWQYGAADTTTAIDNTGDLILMNSAAAVASHLNAGVSCPISERLSAATTAGCTGTDELKQTFFSRIFSPTYNWLYIYNQGNQGDSTYVCFTPKSKAFLTEAQTRCGVAGAGLPPDIAAAARATICTAGQEMICLP